MAVRSVYEKWLEFRSLGPTVNGELLAEDFFNMLRERTADDVLPARLLKGSLFATSNTDPRGATDLDPNLPTARISFEEFVVWSNNTAFEEENVVPDIQERYHRQLAYN